MEETISLKEIFDIIKKHITAVLMSMFIGLGIAGVLTFFVITPEYSSKAQLIVTLPKNESTNVNDVNTNLQMLNTYKDLITGDLVLNEVKDRLETDYNIKMTAAQLNKEITVQQQQNSQMFSIVVKDEKAVNAQHIANTTAQVFQESVKDVLDVDKISIISTAVAASAPISPNNKLNLAIGLFLGLVVGIALAFVFELLDRTVKDDKFVVDTLGFTILGTVPQMTTKELTATIQKKPIKTVENVSNNETTTISGSERSRRSRSRV